MSSLTEVLQRHLILDAELAPAQTRTWPAPARIIFHNIMVYNPLFMLSGLLIFMSTWLVNRHNSEGGRSFTILLQLFSSISAYQICLLIAGLVLTRKISQSLTTDSSSFNERASKPGIERDLRNLLVGLCPFLLDVTFTNANLSIKIVSSHGLMYAGLFVTATLLLSVIGALGAARFTERRFDALSWTALLSGPVVVALLPLAGFSMIRLGAWRELGFIIGLGLSLVVWLLSLIQGEGEDRWVVRRLTPLILLTVTVHGLATAWAQLGSFAYMESEVATMASPLLLVLGVALPRMLWPHWQTQDQVTPLVLPWFGALILGLPASTKFGLNGLGFGFLCVAIVHTGLAVKRRAPVFSLSALVAMHLILQDTALQAPLDLCVLSLVFGLGVYKQFNAKLLALVLALISLRVVMAAPLGHDAGDILLALSSFGTGTLIWSHRKHGCSAEGAGHRFVGSVLLFVPAYIFVLASPVAEFREFAHNWAWASIFGLGALSLLTRLRSYAIPMILPVLESSLSLAPRSSMGWGGLGIAAAFLAMALGVTVSIKREAILKRLSSPPPDSHKNTLEIDSSQGSQWLSSAAFALGLMAAMALAVAPRLGT